jgi:4-hydroxy-3-methylbut-2-enyl diphosphate reductase
MVEILRANEMGFCMGVRRAVQIMEHESSTGKPIASAGEIVHNPRVVEQLEKSGVRQLPGPDEIAGDFGKATAKHLNGERVAITAHGVGEKVLRDIETAGLEIIDTTCPVVTRAQRFAQKFVRDGWHVLIFGDPGHKEVRGIIGWTFDKQGVAQATVTAQSDLSHLKKMIAEFPGGFPNKVGVMAQTTHKMEAFAQFVSNLMLLQRNANFEMHVVNTLCHATTGQQEEAAALAKIVDLMIVVGGQKSANTRHLREVCEEQGTTTYHIEKAEQIDPRWLQGKIRVGLTAGASTPDSSIDEVENRLLELTRA